jgi:hypothetical protein
VSRPSEVAVPLAVSIWFAPLSAVDSNAID